MADAKITISATDLASDVFAKVSDALKGVGGATGDVSKTASDGKPQVDSFTQAITDMGSSFAARVAEGVLLRDAVHDLIDAVKDGIMALPDLVAHTIDVGNSLYEMSLKTGASVENLSALRYVASQTGIDFDSFSSTLSKMEIALGSTGTKATTISTALDGLGLSMQTLKDEKPDQAFIDIMSALEDMPNRADQAAAGMVLFGKGFKDMAGLTQDSITDLMQDASDLGLVMSTNTAAAAHAAEIGFNAFSMQLESVGMNIAATVLPALIALSNVAISTFHDAVVKAGEPLVNMSGTIESVIEGLLGWASTGISVAQFFDDAFEGTKAMLFDVAGKVVDVATGFVGLVSAAASVADKIPGMRGDFTGLASSLQDSKTWLDGFAGGLHSESDAALDAAGKHAVLFAGLQSGVATMQSGFHDAFTKAGQEVSDLADKSHNAFGGIGADIDTGSKSADQLAQSTLNLSEADRGYQGVLEDLGDTVVTAITYELQHKGSIEDITRVYGVNKEQVDILNQSYKDYASELKAVQTIEDGKNANSLTNLVNLDNAQAKSNMSQMTTELKAINDLDKDWSDYYDTQVDSSQTAQEKQTAAVQKWYDDKVLKAAAAGIVDQTYYDGLYNIAQAKFSDVLSLNDPFRKAQQDAQTNLTKDWTSFLGDVYGGFDKTFSTDIVGVLEGKKGFHQVWDDLWNQLEKDVGNILGDLVDNVIQGFIGKAEKNLGGFLASLTDIGSGGGGGLLAGLLPGGGGGGGGLPSDQGDSPGDPGNIAAPPTTAGVGLDPGGSFDPIGQPGNGGTPFANEGFDISLPTRAVVGDNPFQSESVLHASTVKDIVRASRNAAGGSSNAAVAGAITDMHATLRDLANLLTAQNLRLPRMLTEALQLSGL